MLQPAGLKSEEKLLWSPGRGTDVWALMQACASGDLKAVRELIAKDPSLARSHYDYRKPLYFALRENRIDVVRFLLEHDRNPLDLWVDDDPLEIARDRGYAEMEQLLTHTFETRFNTSTKGEPVAAALRNHDMKRMRELLDAQPELVGKGDQRSNQPIHWATMTRQLDAIDELLRRGADINAQRIDGAPAYSLDQWRLLLSRLAGCAAQLAGDSRAGHGAPESARRVHRFTDRVSYRRHRSRARVIAEDPSLANTLGEYEGYYLGRRHAAVKCRRSRAYGHRAAAARSRRRPQSARRADRAEGQGALFRPSSTDITRSPSSCWSVAPFRIRLSRVRVTRCGFRANFAPTRVWSSCSFRTARRRRRNTWMTSGHWRAQLAAHLAAPRGGAQGRCAEAKKLLDSGADVTARDEHLRSTPLAWAAKYGQLEMVKFLLERGAPKSLPDDPAWATPRAWAVRRGHDAIASLLSSDGLLASALSSQHADPGPRFITIRLPQEHWTIEGITMTRLLATTALAAVVIAPSGQAAVQRFAAAQIAFEDDFEHGMGHWEPSTPARIRTIPSGDPAHGHVLLLEPDGDDVYALNQGDEERWTGATLEGDVRFPTTESNLLGVIYNFQRSGDRADFGAVYIKGNDSYLQANPQHDFNVSRTLYPEFHVPLTESAAIVTGKWQRFKVEVADRPVSFTSAT